MLPRTLVFACALVAHAHAALSLDSSSWFWTPLGTNFDYYSDQQTGSASADIVGNADDIGFFTTFDGLGTSSLIDGILAFRIRLDDADSSGGKIKEASFNRTAWVGMDVDGNGSMDLFLGLNRQGSANELGIYTSDNSANTSPNTLGISNDPYFSYDLSEANYNFRPVDPTTDGGTTDDLSPDTAGDPDYYLSFAVSFADLVTVVNARFPGVAFNEKTAMRYIVFTSTQKNSINQDLGGVNGGLNSTTAWVGLGATTPRITAGGTIVSGNVPEPSVITLLGVTGFMLLLRRR